MQLRKTTKGFAPILLIIVVAVIAISSVSYALYFNRVNTNGDPTSQPRNLSQTEKTNKDIQKTGVLLQLLDKMKSYNNYQLDLTTTNASSGKGVNWMILRVGQKQYHELGLVTATYVDNNLGKSFTYLKDKNEYGEDKLSDLGFSVGTPDYYFKYWTSDVKVKGDDAIDGQKVIVYENVSTGITRTAYISAVTGLPAKIVQKSSSGEVTTTFKFSRINEVQETEVTLPANAKKIVNL